MNIILAKSEQSVVGSVCVDGLGNMVTGGGFNEGESQDACTEKGRGVFLRGKDDEGCVQFEAEANVVCCVNCRGCQVERIGG